MELQQNRPAYSGAYLRAKKSAHDFGKAEITCNKRIEAKQETIDEMEEKPRPYKIALAVIFVAVAIILCFVEGANVKQSIMGIGGFSEFIGTLIGAGFAFLGILAGEQLANSMVRDEFSGKLKPTARWYVALLLTLIYVCGQYYLASRAGAGIEGEMLETINTMKIFVLGIAIIEVVVGYLYLSTVIRLFSLLITNIRIRLVQRRMDTTARQTEEYWQRALFENPALSPADETPAIQKARAYYNNSNL